ARCDADSVLGVADAALTLQILAARFPVLVAALADLVRVAERGPEVTNGVFTGLVFAGERNALAFAFAAHAVYALVVVAARLARLHERRHHLPARRLVDGNRAVLPHLGRPLAALRFGDRAHAELEVVAVELGRFAIDGRCEIDVDGVGRLDHVLEALLVVVGAAVDALLAHRFRDGLRELARVGRARDGPWRARVATSAAQASVTRRPAVAARAARTSTGASHVVTALPRASAGLAARASLTARRPGSARRARIAARGARVTARCAGFVRRAAGAALATAALAAAGLSCITARAARGHRRSPVVIAAGAEGEHERANPERPKDKAFYHDRATVSWIQAAGLKEQFMRGVVRCTCQLVCIHNA